jgi:putative membrane protein
MIKILIKWLVLAATILLLPYIISGITVGTTTVALITAAVLGLINIFIKPILKILTLPLNLLTLGLFGFLLNAVLFWVASLVVPGFDILTYSAGIIGSVIVAVVLWLLDKIL